jgi:hypothetical protein
VGRGVDAHPCDAVMQDRDFSAGDPRHSVSHGRDSYPGVAPFNSWRFIAHRDANARVPFATSASTSASTEIQKACTSAKECAPTRPTQAAQTRRVSASISIALTGPMFIHRMPPTTKRRFDASTSLTLWSRPPPRRRVERARDCHAGAAMTRAGLPDRETPLPRTSVRAGASVPRRRARRSRRR